MPVTKSSYICRNNIQMTAKQKLIERFQSLPKDFTFDELSKLLRGFGYEIANKGKTSGSRVRFINIENKSIIDIHRPHPGNIVKLGALKDIYNKLILADVIKYINK